MKRSTLVDGHKTSVSLEGEFWTALKEIATTQNVGTPKLISMINRQRQNNNLSSAIRLHILSYYREQRDAAATISAPLMMHEFKIGQYVYYVPRRAEGRYVVVRLLPQPKGELRYIIRSQDKPEREYMAEASELRRVPGGR